MAITINGTGSITGLTAGGLPDGSVTSADLATGAITSGALPAGSILQVVQTVKTDTFSRTSSGSDYGEITGLSVSITPASTSNKILIIARVSASSGTASSRMAIRLTAAGSVITAYQGSGTGAGSRTSAASSSELDGTNAEVELTATYLHSPSTTSSITYAVQGSAEGNQTFYCNRSGTDSDSASVYRTCSSIIVMEVAA